MHCAQSISGLVVEYIVAIDVTRVRFPADASLARVLTTTPLPCHLSPCPSLCQPFRLTSLHVSMETAIQCDCIGRYRSHFGSRYKLGCCGHAGLFLPCCKGWLLPRASEASRCPDACCPRRACEEEVWPSDSCGVRTHALSEWRLEPPP